MSKQEAARAVGRPGLCVPGSVLQVEYPHMAEGQAFQLAHLVGNVPPDHFLCSNCLFIEHSSDL